MANVKRELVLLVFDNGVVMIRVPPIETTIFLFFVNFIGVTSGGHRVAVEGGGRGV